MGHDPADIEKRLARCERSLFGEDDSSEGISARMHMTETTCAKIESTLSRLNWMLITGIIVGILNILMPRGGTAPASHQSTSVITSDAATTTPDPEEAKAETLAQSRGYYLTADIARKWGKSPKTITDWIAGRRFNPQPTQHGREYHFHLDTIENTETAAIHRSPPLSAADNCATDPQ